MSAMILATKLHIPQPRPGFVSRPHLIARLQDGLAAGHKLTLISASAGFGKTTLLSEWIGGFHSRTGSSHHQAGIRYPQACWVSLDEADSDLSRFLVYLIAALRTIQPGFGESALAALQTPQPPPSESLLAILLNEISELPGKYILVLDDYHLLDSAAVDAALDFVLDHLPAQLHLVLASREDPPLPLARLRARNQMTELRAADLRFSASEASDFLKRVMGLALSTEEIASLEARTEGWIAGLQLAALSMREHDDIAGFIQSFTGSHRFVLDYLLEEVLRHQPQDVQEFLLRTSILDRMCAPLCDAVLGASKVSSDFLESLERGNLFLVPLDNERCWYRYHHLFSDFLRQRLSQKYDRQEITHTHIRASEYFEQYGDLAESFRHAISAGDLERAARLAEVAWQGMDGTFQTAAWLGWVKQIPERMLLVRPVLLAQTGWSHMDAGNTEESEANLKNAESCLERPLEELVVVEKEQFRTLPARIAMARAYNALVQNLFDDAIKFVEMAQSMAPPDDAFLQAQASSILSGTHWASGNLDSAYALMNHWVNAAQQAGNLVFAVVSSFAKADILTAQGRLGKAMQVYEDALELASAHGLENFTAHHHLGLGLLYHEIGRDEYARQYIQKSFELEGNSSLVDWAYRKSLALGRLKESEGDWPGVLEALDNARRFYVRTPLPNLRPVEAMRACIYLKQGDVPKAQAWARQSGLLLSQVPDYFREFEYLTLVRVGLAESLDEQSLADIDNVLACLLEKAESQNRFFSQMEILMTQALVNRARRDSTGAQQALRRVLHIAQPEGYLRFFVTEGEIARLLIADYRLQIVKSGQAKPDSSLGYVEKILAVFPQLGNVPIQKSKTQNFTSEMAEALSERELEVLRLVAQGLSNHDISQNLFVAISTVKGHNQRIFAKLQVSSRTEAVARAHALGLL
jgi:LuxR family transcriptional regulator, maltose regulon positive regulatory protein